MFNILKFAAMMCLIVVSISSHNDLKSLDQLIQKYRKPSFDEPLHIQKIDSFSLPFQVTAHESIKITSKMKSFSNILADQTTLYSMNGEVLLNFTKDSIFTSMKNSYIYLLNQTDTTLDIYSVVAKMKFLQPELITKVQTSSKAISFVVSGIPRVKSFFIVAYENNSLVKYSEKGVYISQNDQINEPIRYLTKGSLNIFALTQTQIVVLDNHRVMDESNCSIIPGGIIKSFYTKTDELFVHSENHLLIYSISRCQLSKSIQVPPNSSVSQFGQYVLIVTKQIAYCIDLQHQSIKPINIKLRNQFIVETIKKSQSSTYIIINNPSEKQVIIYEYVGVSEEPFEMKGFKLPIFLLIIGVVIYYTYKKKQDSTVKGQEQRAEPKDSNEQEKEKEEEMSQQELQKFQKFINSDLMKKISENAKTVNEKKSKEKKN